MIVSSTISCITSRKEEHMYVQWCRVFSNMGAFFSFIHSFLFVKISIQGHMTQDKDNSPIEPSSELACYRYASPI
jgi:hypothetical protein